MSNVIAPAIDIGVSVYNNYSISVEMSGGYWPVTISGTAVLSIADLGSNFIGWEETGNQE